MNESKFASQREQISNYIKDEVEALVDEKMVALSKHSNGNEKVSREEVQEQCYRQAYESLEHNIEEMVDACDAFYTQLKIDNPRLEKELIGKFASKVSDQNDINAFIAEFDPATVSLSKEESDEIVNLGMQWFDDKEWEKALVYFSFLCCVEPNNPVRFVLKGMSLHNLKRYDEALRSYILATLLAPNYLFAHIQLMKTLIVYQKWDVLNQYYDSFLQEVDQSTYERDQFVLSELKKINTIILKHKS